MKIQIASDLHLEHWRQSHPLELTDDWLDPDAEILVLAGDVCDYQSRYKVLPFLEAIGWGNERPVLYVLGNHEFYRCRSAHTVPQDFAESFDGTNVKIAYCASHQIEDTLFTLATLWTDLSNPLDRLAVGRGLNDFAMPDLTTDWYLNAHLSQVDFLTRELDYAQAAGLKSVVVTHHAPSYRSVHPRFVGSSLNPGFASHLDAMLEGPSAPNLWIHGHMHDPCDYQVEGGCRVVCNPYGYPGEHKPATFGKIIVDV